MITPDEYLFDLVPCTKAQLIEQFKRATFEEIHEFVAQIDKECNAMIKLKPGLDSTKVILAKFKPLRNLAEKHAKTQFLEALK